MPLPLRRAETGLTGTPVHRYKHVRPYHLEGIAIALFVIAAAALVTMRFIPGCFQHHTYLPITATSGSVCALSLLAFTALMLERIC